MNLSDYDSSGFSRGTPRFQEAFWILCEGVFFLPWWPVPSGIRAWLLRCFGAKVGRGLVIRSGVDISFPWRLSLGDHVWLGEGVKILSLDQVSIGSHVCLSQQAFLCTGSHDHRHENFSLLTKPITIESEVWVAARAFIAPGVRIGSKALVGACAVVLHDVASSTFVAGNPARPRGTSS